MLVGKVILVCEMRVDEMRVVYSELVVGWLHYATAVLNVWQWNVTIEGHLPAFLPSLFLV